MKKKRAKPPVETGHYDRSEEHKREIERENEAAAPDGVSGSWT